MTRGFHLSSKIYSPGEIGKVIDSVKDQLETVSLNTKERFYNIPCSFDIETTSFFRTTGNDEEKEKVAIMYVWAFGIGGLVVIGRTWEEFTTMLSELSERLDLDRETRLLCYVHNLSFDFSFLHPWLKFSKVFAISNRKPVYALTTLGIEFRCSYLLSGQSLAKIGNDLRKYKISKLTGDLDYNLERHQETPLTEKELGYISHDVLVVMAYIQETIEREGDITKIPLTKTGYVRRFCRNACFYEEGKSHNKSVKRLEYLKIMSRLTVTKNEYHQLKRAFQGGFTHANPFYSGIVVENVTSFDFTSSYPAVMLSEKFPMGPAEKVGEMTETEFEKNLKLYCCLFDIQFINLQPKRNQDSYISISRCRNVDTAIVNNGRVVSAKSLVTTITEQDFTIIEAFYTWDHIRVFNFKRYKKDYLPTDFVKAIIKLYKDKTTLKNVPGKEIDYLLSKEMLNSCYGMCVTDIVRDEYGYNYDTHQWNDPNEPDYYTAIRKYNYSKSRFLFYPWGVWVTAYARRNLFTGIVECGMDYIYSDTDSIKITNAENHLPYIRKYNDWVTYKLRKAMEYHGIPYEDIEPMTVKGEKKPLGVWDFDGEYSRFKTLGAKRYLVEEKKTGEIILTVSGLNKQTAVSYMKKLQGPVKNGLFDWFKNGLYIPPGYTGKQTHTYIDTPKEGHLTDYTGRTAHYYERSGVHLGPADYSLGLAREYIDYILGLREIDI